ncbi:unnamed protein product [Spirodela intermedia]|uniref:NAD(P)-binding domain-containing protein n=1 Tax=Spirodela intermedia TaxID=51605 RepID=A0A7I8IV91_SPIIN|nr:unnamed protein product [Spirodela intermedia]CAA6661728.1 unnamed protein product [Spirodela intermedia]
MAPALSSSSFRLAAAQPHAKPHFRSSARSATAATVFAKLGGGNGPPAGDEGAEAEGAPKKNPFFLDIDFSKLGEDARSLVPAAGNGSSSSPSTALIFSNRRRKDPLTVFVAGASGQAGVRITRTLLRRGFSVRAGVPDLAAAQELARIAAQYKIITPEESKRLNAVESGFGDAESIARAIGNATKVVVTVGRGEDGPSAAVTTDDAFRVVQAAQLAGVGHVVVIYDAAAGSPEPSTNNVLDGITSFFSNIFSPAKPSLTVGQFLEKVAKETEVSYTLVKASLADDIAAEQVEPRGLVVAGEGTGAAAGAGTAGDYKVPKSQIASLVADVMSNVSVAENKVVEVSARSTAPSRPINELFSAIPEDGRRKAYKEAVAKAKAEEEAVIASEKAREAADMAKKLEEEMKKLSEQEARAANLADEARKKALEAGASMESILAKAKGISGDFSWDKLGSQFATAIAQRSEEIPKTQVATVRGQAKARALPPLKAVVRSPPPKPTRSRRHQEPDPARRRRSQRSRRSSVASSDRKPST